MASRGERWGTDEMHWPPFKMGKEKGGVALLGRETRLADDEEFSQPKLSTGEKRTREREREQKVVQRNHGVRMNVYRFLLGGTQTTTLKDKNVQKISIK